MKSFFTFLLFNIFFLPLFLSANPTLPPENDMYTCGIFPSVLTSYTSLAVEQNDVYNTCALSVAGSTITESSTHPIICYDGPSETSPNLCTCDPSTQNCSYNNTCELIPEPTNRYDHDFIDSSEPFSTVQNVTGTITGLNHPSYNLVGDVTFDANETYSNSSTKVMLTGNIEKTDTGKDITVNEGDYYFKSWNMDGNNHNLYVDGNVRFFVEGDYTVAKKLNVEFLNADSSLFIYVGGDLTFTGNGGGNYETRVFFYVEGDATIYNSAATSRFLGGITAEGTLEIDPGASTSNAQFEYDDEAAGNLGFGECSLCFTEPLESGSTTVSTTIINTDTQSLSSLVVSKAYDYTGYTESTPTTTTGSAASSSSISIPSEVVGYPNFTVGSTKSGFVYDIGDFNVSKQDTLTDTTNIAFSIDDYNITTPATVKALYIANYSNDGKSYSAIVDKCWNYTTPTYLITGPFDAWDIFRDDNSVPPADKNISTKVVNKPFKLSLASLDENSTAYATKSGAGSNIEVAIYPTGSSTPISNVIIFDANTTSHIAATTSNFTITKASKDASVYFKLCAKYDGSVFTMHPTGDCVSPTVNDCYTTATGTPVFQLCKSTDNLAVRPDNILLTPPAPLLTAGATNNFNLSANKYASAVATTDYNVTSANTELNINRIAMYESPTNSATIDNALDGNATFSSTIFNVVNGVSATAGIIFDEAGKATIRVRDMKWSLVDADDTPAICDDDSPFGAYTIPNGQYVCGDVNSTFIPDHFRVHASVLHDNNDSTFTYMSNDLNMSAYLDVIITAENEQNTTTHNFKSGSWENPVDVNFTLATTSTPTVLRDAIDDTVNLGFVNGFMTIGYDANSSKNLLFNFQRDVNNSLNPFVVNGTDINITATSVYPAGYVASSSVASITGVAASSDSATFIYGRSHAPKQRYEVVTDEQNNNANIYYEAFCYGTDTLARSCDKTLLPGLNRTDDIRWYINPDHNTSSDGIVSLVIQKGGTGATSDIVDASSLVLTNPTTVNLSYDASQGYTYRTTMEIGSSGWLIYNEGDPTATRNQFSAEFNKANTGWSGEAETDTTTKDTGTANTNRRSMW